MYSQIIKNALLIDGSGSPERHCDIAIQDDKIVAIADKIETSSHEFIDAKGKIVAPGFIDTQNHSDSYWQLFDNPSLNSMIAQGYTTVFTGQCGASLAPLLSQEALLSLQKWHNLEGTNINWQTFGEFAGAMSERRFGCNIASFVGYSTLRRGLKGDNTEPITNEELKALKQALHNAIDQGAFGLSTGLAYSHEVRTSDLELYELAEVLKATNTSMSIHLRDEGESVVESVREAIAIAQRAEIPIKISHLKICGSKNWRMTSEVLAELDNAWHQGVRIHYDAYPYTSIWQVLYKYLPTWAIQGGRHVMLNHLHNPTQRNKILSYLNEHGDIKNLIIASTSAGLHVTGKSIGKLAADMEVSSEEALLNIVENGGSEISVFDNCLDEGSVAELTNHPLSFIATDGAGFPLKSQRDKLVHPRCFGTAPKFLRGVIDSGKISLPEAIRKLTSAPAAAMGLSNRGTIKAGNFADLVLFDPQTIRDRATTSNPYQYAEGIEAVWVNGKIAVRNGRPVEILAGKFIRKNT